jgi:NADPH:quinone reductase-like Zn-dependent oxidoreductase
VRVGGTVAVIGNLAGNREPVSVLPILMRGLRVRGVFVGHRRSFEALCAALATHAVHPLVHAVYPFDAAPEAYAALARGEHTGKICITA